MAMRRRTISRGSTIRLPSSPVTRAQEPSFSSPTIQPIAATGLARTVSSSMPSSSAICWAAEALAVEIMKQHNKTRYLHFTKTGHKPVFFVSWPPPRQLSYSHANHLCDFRCEHSGRIYKDWMISSDNGIGHGVKKTACGTLNQHASP